MTTTRTLTTTQRKPPPRQPKTSTRTGSPTSSPRRSSTMKSRSLAKRSTTMKSRWTATFSPTRLCRPPSNLRTILRCLAICFNMYVPRNTLYYRFKCDVYLDRARALYIYILQLRFIRAIYTVHLPIHSLVHQSSSAYGVLAKQARYWHRMRFFTAPAKSLAFHSQNRPHPLSLQFNSVQYSLGRVTLQLFLGADRSSINCISQLPHPVTRLFCYSSGRLYTIPNCTILTRIPTWFASRNQPVSYAGKQAELSDD